MKKKILLMFFAVFTLTMTAFTAAYADDITIVVNGTSIETDTAPVIMNDRTMVPLRAISASLECGVGWDDETQSISVLKQVEVYSENEEQLVLCWIGRENAFVLNGFSLGKKYSMDSPPVIVNDRTLVPVRAISELLGATVDWDDASRTVLITAPKAEVYNPEEDDILAENLAESYGGIMLSMYDIYSDYADGKARTINAQIGLANGGVINLELYPDLAPETVSNFAALARAGAFDNTIFHRVISGFVIQGGAFETNGSQRDSDPVTGEFIANGVFNLIPHNRGTISMARVADDNNSGSNQFFIMHNDYPYLNGQYAAFGKVTSGMEYVDEIASAATDENDKPLTDHIISYVKILD